MRRLLIVWLLWMAATSAFAVETHDVSLAQGRLLLTERHEGWGKGRCQSCHVLRMIHGDAPHIRDIVRAKGFDTCGGCHGDNGAGVERRCAICHNPRDLPASPYLTGIHAHDFTIDGDRPLADGDCMICHWAADMDGRWEIDTDLTRFPDAAGFDRPYRRESEFCLRCHNRSHQQPGFPVRARDYLDPLVAVEESWRYMDYHGWAVGSGDRIFAGLRDGYRYGTELACTECHAMHGTDNPKLILDDSRKGAFGLSFRDRGVPVQVFAPGDYSQLCVLCHAMTTPLEDAHIDTGNGLSGVHQVGGDCTLCHTHGRAAQVGL